MNNKDKDFQYMVKEAILDAKAGQTLALPELLYHIVVASFWGLFIFNWLGFEKSSYIWWLQLSWGVYSIFFFFYKKVLWVFGIITLVQIFMSAIK